MEAVSVSIYPIKTVFRPFWMPLQHRLMQCFTARAQRHAAAAPRPVSQYTMLVASDVYRGVHGILP